MTDVDEGGAAMSPERFRECLSILHWSQNKLADIVMVDERTVRRWAAGQYPIPAPVARWLDTLATFHAAHPPPVRREF